MPQASLDGTGQEKERKNLGKRENEVTSKGGEKKGKGAETTLRSKRGVWQISKLTKSLTPTNLASKREKGKERRISGHAKLKEKTTNLLLKDRTAGLATSQWEKPRGTIPREGEKFEGILEQD